MTKLSPRLAAWYEIRPLSIDEWSKVTSLFSRKGPGQFVIHYLQIFSKSLTLPCSWLEKEGYEPERTRDGMNAKFKAANLSCRVVFGNSVGCGRFKDELTIAFLKKSANGDRP